MSLRIERLEKNKAKLTIEVTSEEFDRAADRAYNKNKNKISIPGFRKGKVPRQMAEKMYGYELLYEDAANEIIHDAYLRETENCGLDIVSQPDVDLVQMKKGMPFIFSAVVDLKPEVTLGNYKKLKVDKEKAEVTDDDVNAELDRVREQNSRIVPVSDRAVKDGDITIIDFEGFVDGKPFDGGRSSDYSLTIGSHSFVDTFEEQIIGMEIGEEKEINITFPENYTAVDLKGKPAMFKVTVKEIKEKELPEADDEFAQDVSEFDTISEYKEDIKKNLLEKKEKAVRIDIENKAVEMIIENSSMEIPESMIDAQVIQMAEDYVIKLRAQGLDVEQYFKYAGITRDKFMKDLRPQALKRIQSRLVLEAIAKAENIEVSDAEVENEIADMAALYKMETDELKENMSSRELKDIMTDIAVQKAMDFVVDNIK